MQTAAPRGVLLDIDGTLLDSNVTHARAWVDVLAEEGFAVELERVKGLIGKGGDKVLPELTGLDAESERGKRITGRRGELFKSRYLPSCRPFPGARDLLLRMRADDLRLVVATSASEAEVDDLLRAAEVLDLIDRATTSDDAARSKPDPDIVEAAVQRARLPHRDLVMLGDTPYDVEAANRAGVAAIALRSGGWDRDALGRAVAIYEDVAELLANYETSPLASRG